MPITTETAKPRFENSISNIWGRAKGQYKKATSRLLFRRPLPITAEFPIISFTFDDFPRSALLEGASILERFGARGTYYTSLGLMGTEAPPGTMFVEEDLHAVVERGHELGCHTFGHCHSWNTTPAVFEQSVIRNREALKEILPRASFRTLSYPIAMPRATTKRRIARYFTCCRGGGHTVNTGIADLNFVRAYFVERAREHPTTLTKLVDFACREKGWLVFATHDICDSPSPYGCTPHFFESIVQYAANSGARIMPVADACELLKAHCSIRPLSYPCFE